MSRALAFALATWLFGACGDPLRSTQTEEAASFDLPLVGGGRVSLASLRGKAVLIDFWATWCPPCLLEIPELNAILEETRGESIEILAISVDAMSLEALEQWVKANGVAYPVALGDSELAAAFGADGFPYHVLVDSNGRIRARLASGFHDRDELRALLAAAAS